MNLAEYILAHVDRGECKCGKCADVGSKPDPAGPHVVDMVFYKVAKVGEPTAEEFEKLTNGWPGEFNRVDIWDGKEHSYMELGGWLGSQDLALQYMALGVLVGIFILLSPVTVLEIPSTNSQAQELAGNGFLWIIPRPQYRKVLHDAPLPDPELYPGSSS